MQKTKLTLIGSTQTMWILYREDKVCKHKVMANDVTKIQLFLKCLQCTENVRIWLFQLKIKRVSPIFPVHQSFKQDTHCFVQVFHFKQSWLHINQCFRHFEPALLLARQKKGHPLDYTRQSRPI